MPEPIAVAYVEVRPQVAEFRGEAEDELQAALGGDLTADVEIGGLKDARREADQLTTSLRQAANVDLSGAASGLPDLANVARDADETRAAFAALEDVAGTDFAAGFTEGAAEALRQVNALGSGTEDLAGDLTGAEQRAQALRLALLGAGSGSDFLSRATRVAAAASRDAALQEDTLAGSLRRRAAAQGALKLVGVGLVAGTALLAARQGLAELAEGLRVSGNEAASTRGQLRNFGAEILSGNVIGAFKALSFETETYTIRQLRGIAASKEFAEALREMGKEADIAKSAAAGLETLTQVPQFLQTAIARENLQGNEAGQLDALKQADEALKEQIAIARTLGADRQVLNAALEELFTARAAIQKDIQALTQKEQVDPLEGLSDAVQKAELSGSTDKILAALRNEQAALEELIAGASTSAADRRRARGQLIGVNSEIESIQDAIVAEEKRHQQAMRDKRLLPSQEAQVVAELRGDTQGQIAALRAEAAEIQKILDTKKLEATERIGYLNRLVAINREIESIQDGVVAEQQRHADEMQRKREDAHQALLDSLGTREASLQTEALRAQLTESLANDIAVQRDLVAFYRDAQRRSGLTVAERERFIQSEIQAQLQLRSLIAQQKQAGRDAVRDELSATEDRLQDRLAIARTTEKNLRDDERALRAQVAFFRKQARNRDLTLAERRDFLVKQRQAERELRDLAGKTSEGGSFEKQSFAFLKELQGFSSNLAGNLLAADASIGKQPTTRPTATTATRPPTPPPRPSPVGPFERTAATDATGAQRLRDRGGAPASAGQIDELIHIGRNTNLLLRRLAEGVGHGEARASRALGRNVTQVGMD